MSCCWFLPAPAWSNGKCKHTEKPFNLILMRHLINAASQICMSPKVRDTSLAKGSFSLTSSSQLFFQTAFSHLLWFLHFPCFRIYPDSQYLKYQLHSFMNKKLQDWKHVICKGNFLKKVLNIWNQPHFLSQSNYFIIEP